LGQGTADDGAIRAPHVNTRIRRRKGAAMKWRVIVSAVAVSALALAGVATAGGRDDSARSAVADLVGPTGAALGAVRLDEHDGHITVTAKVRGLTPGFHGFHVHAVGACDGPSFTSAGGHLNPADSSHPEHAGDMPVLLVNADGTARASVDSDRFGLSDLFDLDGSAIIVHANADNYANIPTDRYDPDPDATTLATGDAGGRVACGVVEPA
jgi:Cu-Zn family superoxide dismutase